jgi:hypothetical protein
MLILALFLLFANGVDASFTACRVHDLRDQCRATYSSSVVQGRPFNPSASERELLENLR